MSDDVFLNSMERIFSEIKILQIKQEASANMVRLLLSYMPEQSRKTIKDGLTENYFLSLKNASEEERRNYELLYQEQIELLGRR